MALRVRATFLEEQTEGAQMAALIRSRSAPGLTSAQKQHQEVSLQIQRLYCEDLSSKIAALGGSRKSSGKASVSTACSGLDLLSQVSTSTQAGSDSDNMEASVAPRAPCRRCRGVAAPAQALTTNEALAKSILLSKALAKTSTEASTCSSGSNSMRLGASAASHTTRSKRWADMAEDSDCDSFNFEVKSTNSSSSLSRPSPASPAAREEMAADDELEALRSAMNAGSWGHPELCSRPCLYFAAGVCANAKDCDYCHLPHSKRPAHLDKRQRSELEQLAPCEWAALIVPILESRVVAVDASEEAARLVEAVANQCGGNSCRFSNTRNAPPRGQRVLMLTLRAMSLRALIATVLRSGATHGFDLTECSEALMTRLRSSTAGVHTEPRQE